MMIRQGSTTRISWRLATIGLLLAGGLSMWIAGVSLAQTAQQKHSQEAQREAERRREDARAAAAERIRANQQQARDRAASRPARPDNMRDYNRRKQAASRPAAPEPEAEPGEDMKIQAEEIPAVDEAHLAELQNKARAEARAPAPPPPTNTKAPSTAGPMNTGISPSRPLTTMPAGPAASPPVAPSPGPAITPQGAVFPSTRPAVTPGIRPVVMPPTATQPGNMPFGTAPRPVVTPPAPGVTSPYPPLTTRSVTTPGVTLPGGPTPGLDAGDGLPNPRATNPNWWSLPPEERVYLLSWNNTPLQKTLQDISDLTGLTVVTGQIAANELTGKLITFQSVRLHSYDEMLTTYNMLVFDFGYWLVHRGDYLEIRALSEWYRHIPPDHMYASMEEYQAAKLPKWDVASVVYAPKFALPDELAQIATDLVPLNGARAVILPTTERIQMAGFVYFIDDQLEIMRKRDVEPEDPRPVQTYTLQYTSVEDADRMLRAMLPQSTGPAASISPGPTQPPGPGGVRAPVVAAPVQAPSMADIVEIQPDQRSNRLVIKATPVKHKLVADYLKKYIDRPIEDPGNVRLFEIKYADPDQLVDMIKPLLGQTRPMNMPPGAPVAPGQPPQRGQPQPQPGQPQPQPVVMPTVTVGTSAVILSFPQSRSVLAKANKDEMVQIEKYIKMLDVDVGFKNFEYVKLERASASSVAAVLGNVLGGARRPGVQLPGQVQFLAASDPANDKVVILRGEPQDLTDAHDLIKQLDVDPEAGAVEHVVQLKDAEPDAVVEVLRSRYPESSGGGGSRRSLGYNPYGGYMPSSSGGGGSALPRFIAEPQSKSLIVVSYEQTWPEIERLIQDLDQRSHTRNVTKIYHLRYTSPSDMADILGASFGSGGGGYRRRGGYSMGGYSGGDDSDRPSFQYAPDSDALVITANDELQERAAKLITELDQPGPSDKAQPRPIQLVKADAEYVAGKIEDLLSDGGRGHRSRGSYYGDPYGGGGGSDQPNKVQVRVVAETMTNRVFVTASDEDFKKAEDLAKSIDEQFEKAEVVRKTFVLTHADPAEVRSVIETMFENDVVADSRRSHRSSGSYGGYDYGGSRDSSSSSKPDAVRLYDTSDSLIVMAPKAKMEQIETVVKEFDTDAAGSNQIKTYKVEGVGYDGTRDIADNLGELFGAGQGRGGESGRSSESKIKFVGERGSDILLVSAPAARMPEIDQKVQEILKLKTSADLSFVIKHFDVQRAKPEDVAEIIEPILTSKYQELQQKGGRFDSFSYFGGGNSPQVTAHRNARRIMVSAPQSLMPLVQELLDEFDQQPTASTTKIVTLKTGKAEEVVPAVQQMMSEGRSSGGGSYRSRSPRRWMGDYFGMDWGGYGSNSRSNSGGSDELQMTAIESSNLIMLHGPMDKVVQAEELIKQLDAESKGDGPVINVYKLKYADLYEIAGMIEDMVGGGSLSDSSSSYTSRRSRSSGDVVVKTDYANGSLIVSATREKIPMIEQIIDLKDRPPPPPAEIAGSMGTPVQGAAKRGEIAKRYDVAKNSDVNETAKKLDEILYTEFGFDAPYVKAFPFANQIVVTGSPEHFKEVENWLSYFAKNPVEPKYTVAILHPDVSPSQIVSSIQQSLSPQDSGKVNFRSMPGLGAKDPLKSLKEVQWYDPIAPTSQPSGPTTVVQPVSGTSPFVPTGELRELRAAVAALGLAQTTVTPATRPAVSTRPAADRSPRPVVATRPATTRPAAKPAQPVAKPLSPDLRVLARPSTPAPTAAPAPSPAPPAPAQPSAVPPSTPVTMEAASPRESIQKAAMDAALEARTSGQVQIRYDEDKKVIYVVGPDLAVQSYKKLIEDVEKSLKESLGQAETPTDIRVFTLNYVDVNVAAAILEQMFNDKAGQPGQQQAARPPRPKAKKPSAGPEAKNGKEGEDEEGSARRRREEDEAKEEEESAAKGGMGGQRIRVFADSRTRTIIVRAAEQDFPAVAELVLKIDRPGEGAVTEIKVFQLKKLNAYDVEMAIKAVLKIEDTRSRMMMNRPFGNRMGGMGMGGAEAMVEQLQAEMMQVEMQANLAAAGQPNQPGAPGQGQQFKLNPSKDISLTSDSTTNTIIVTAPKEGMVLVEKLINTLEEQTIPMQIKTFPIKHGDAEQVATQLERLFQGGAGGSTGRGRRGGRGGSDLSGGGFNPFSGMNFGGFTGFEGSRSGEIRIAADTRTNTIIVRALEPDMEKLEPIIQQIDQEGLGGHVVLYPIENGNAADMAKLLTSTFVEGDRSAGQAIRIAADATTNTILVWAPEAAQKQIGEKIKEIDQKGLIRVQPREVPLTFASAGAVAEKLQAIYLGGRGHTGGPGLKIEGDDNSSVVFVTAPEELFKQIETTIKTLDKPTRQDIRVYHLKYAVASEILASFKETTAQLMQRVGGAGGGSSLAQEPIAASADTRTNSIMVTGSPAVHLVVEKVLKQLDVQATSRQALIPLTNARAEELAEVLKQTLASRRGGKEETVSVAADPNTNALVVAGSPGDIEGIKQMVASLDKPAVLPDEELRVIPLQNIDATESLKIMTEYLRKPGAAAAKGAEAAQLTGGVRLQASATMNAMIVSGMPAQIDHVQNKLQLMDAQVESGNTAPRFKIIPIGRGLDPEVLATEVETTINQGELNQARKQPDYRPGQITISADYLGPSLIVGGTPQLFDHVEKLVKELTSQRPNGYQRDVRVIKVQNLDPKDVQRVLNQVMQDRNGGVGSGNISRSGAGGARRSTGGGGGGNNPAGSGGRRR